MNVKQVTFQESKENWKQIEQNSKTASFFQTYDWHAVFLKHFPQEAFILEVSDGNEVIGIAPFIRRENRVEFMVTQPVLGEELVTDYGDVIVQEGKEKDFWRVVLDYVTEQKLSLQLNFVRESSPTYQILTTYYSLLATEHDVAPYLPLNSSWEEYLEQLPRHNRQELRRKMRKIETPGVVLRWSEKPVEESAELFRLMRLSSEDKIWFLTPAMEEFFKDVIQSFPVRLCFLSEHDKNIAAVLTFEYQHEVLLYNSGFDWDYKTLSPGLMSKGFVLKDAFDTGKKRFDFLRGSERYKYNLGGIDQTLYRVIIQ